MSVWLWACSSHGPETPQWADEVGHVDIQRGRQSFHCSTGQNPPCQGFRQLLHLDGFCSSRLYEDHKKIYLELYSPHQGMGTIYISLQMEE